MSDSPFFPECGTCRLVRAILMFIIGYSCFNLTMSDYTTGSMIFSTESKTLNEAILTCIVLTGMCCISYGIFLVISLFKPKDVENKYADEPVEMP